MKYWDALPRASRRIGVAGIVALLLCVLGAWFDRAAFFQAWLITWLFLLGIALAGMMQVMIHEITGGEWGLVLRPPLEGAMSTLPLLALFAIPLAFGLSDLFPWARSQAAEAQRWWLNAPGFLVRNAVWLVAWSAFALALRRHLATPDPRRAHTRRRIAVAGLMFYLCTITLAAFDWIASLVPDWASTAIGIRLGAGQFVAAFGFAIPLAVVQARAGGPPAASSRDWQDLGNLLLTFAMMWVYIAFSQYLIIWAEDLPRETAWYWPRTQTSWRYLVAPLVTLNFALPVVAMLFREVKCRGPALALICALALVGQWLDTLWLIAPSVRPQGFSVHAMDLLALVGLGGIWLALVTARAERLRAGMAAMRGAAP